MKTFGSPVFVVESAICKIIFEGFSETSLPYIFDIADAESDLTSSLRVTTPGLVAAYVLVQYVSDSPSNINDDVCPAGADCCTTVPFK